MQNDEFNEDYIQPPPPPPEDSPKAGFFALPKDEEAELAVLASMMFDADALMVGAEHITASDFFRADYKLIFQSIYELYLSNIPVDLITLKDRLTLNNVFEVVGGLPALTNILSSISTSVNIMHYIKIMKDKSTLRKIINYSQNINKEAYEGATSAENVLDNAEKGLFAISQNQNQIDFIGINEALVQSINKIEAAYNSGSKIIGIESGFADLDTKTAGFHPSDLILIAARPSMGKTAMALNIAANAAIRKNIPTAIFSLEMSAEQLANRLISSEARVDANKLRNGQLDKADWDRIADKIGQISNSPIFLDDSSAITIQSLRSKCRKLKMDKGLGLILIDYLQLMQGSDRLNENRQQEISEISRQLKSIAREMECPVIALSQLSRSPESRADKRPILSDLRESGAIEQDADLVCFIYRDEYYNPETDDIGVAEIIISKQRNGETGTIKLNYQGNYVRFTNLQY